MLLMPSISHALWISMTYHLLQDLPFVAIVEIARYLYVGLFEHVCGSMERLPHVGYDGFVESSMLFLHHHEDMLFIGGYGRHTLYGDISMLLQEDTQPQVKLVKFLEIMEVFPILFEPTNEPTIPTSLSHISNNGDIPSWATLDMLCGGNMDGILAEISR